MRILAVGDMHIKLSSMDLLRKARNSLRVLVKESKPDYLVLMGDQLDGHNVIQLSCLNTLAKILEELVLLTKTINAGRKSRHAQQQTVL